MFTTIPTFSQCVEYLMECTPSEVRTDHILADILALPEVARIDDFHVWGLAGDKFFLTAHVKLNGSHRAINSSEEPTKNEINELYLVNQVHDKCLRIAKKNNI